MKNDQCKNQFLVIGRLSLEVFKHGGRSGVVNVENASDFLFAEYYRFYSEAALTLLRLKCREVSAEHYRSEACVLSDVSRTQAVT